MVPLWQAIEALDNKVADAVQSQMLIEAGWLTARATTWFLRSRRLTEPMEQTIRASPRRSRRCARASSREAGARRRRSRRVDGGRRAGGAGAARGERRHAVRGARHRRGRRGGPIAASATLRDVHVGVGTRLGLARLRQQIERCRRTATGKAWRRSRSATISPACSVRSPRAFSAAAKATRRN